MYDSVAIVHENLPFPQTKCSYGKGMITMDKEKDQIPDLGSAYEGRDKVSMDVDRMINEGMSGGSVHAREETTNIEEARELHEEQPPYECE
jgi:hypothetical protein